MKNRILLGTALGLFLQTMSGAGVATEGVQLEGTAPATAGPPRDPFTTSQRMHTESGRYAASNAVGGHGFIPSVGFEQIPKMWLRGFVNKVRSVAVLQIDGVGTYLVRKGDEIGLQAIGRNTVIRIVDVDGMSVKVQAGMINQVIVVR